MRQRLAVEHPPEYFAIRDNFEWADHAARTLVTAGLVAWLAPDFIWDPACGDASILEAAYKLRPFQQAFLGDISIPQIEALKVSFPHQKSVMDLTKDREIFVAATFKNNCLVLTEVLEHLEDPDGVLRQAREAFSSLVASSPIGDPELGRNHEHLWAWDEEGYEEMLRGAGWNPIAKSTVMLPGVAGNSQIWVAR